MPVNPDFRDLFAALNAAGARYLLVGGYAVAFHAQPRFTKDLDVWTDLDPANATRVFGALRQFGAPLHELTTADLERSGTVFQLGVPPNRTGPRGSRVRLRTRSQAIPSPRGRLIDQSTSSPRLARLRGLSRGAFEAS